MSKKLIQKYQELYRSLGSGPLIPKWKLLRLSQLERALERRGYQVKEQRGKPPIIQKLH